MDTSVILIGLAITAMIAIPLYFAMRSNQINKNKLKALMAQHPAYQFEQVETQNKRTYALDTSRKGFLLVDFHHKPEKSSFVDLKNVASCRLVLATDHFSGDTTKIELEFVYKDTARTLMAVYDIAFDQITQVCLREDHELAKRWQEQLSALLTK